MKTKFKNVIITGPSGAGKTTTCKSLLGELDGVWAYINQDELRQIVASGYSSAKDYSYNWSDETKRQWRVSIPVCVDIMKRYNEFGMNCLLDIFAPPEEFTEWQSQLGDSKYELVVLLPDQEETVARNKARRERSRLKDNKIRQNHDLFTPWANSSILTIDTTKNTVEDTVNQIKKIL